MITGSNFIKALLFLCANCCLLLKCLCSKAFCEEGCSIRTSTSG